MPTSIGVDVGLHSVIMNFLKSALAYLTCDKKIACLDCKNSTPKQ